MIEVARERVPDAHFDVGDIQFLPYDDQSFDAVAGFHSVPFAAQPLEALREAHRVAKPAAAVLVVVFKNPAISPKRSRVGVLSLGRCQVT